MSIKMGEQMPTEIYRLVNKETGDIEGAYSRASHTEYDFYSPESARRSNIHGIFEDKEKYRVVKYKITYEIIDEDA